MREFYTITEVAAEVASRTGQPCSADKARKVCARNGLGEMLNTRCRMIPSGQLEEAIGLILASKKGQPAGWNTVNAKPERPANKVVKKQKKH